MQPTLFSLAKQHGTAKLFREGSMLFLQGEIPRHVHLIQDGIVRGYSITNNGDERVLAFYGKGDVTPLAWALGGSSSAFCYYQAITDTRVITLDYATFLQLQKTPEFAQELLKATGREFTGAMLRIMSLAQSRTIDKLAYTLYYLGYHFGISRPGGETVINMKLSQILLAAMIGQTREGTARNLKQLVDGGIVSYRGSTYTVYLDRLLATLGEDDFRSLV